MEDIEKTIKTHVLEDMQTLENNMKLFKDMQSAYAFKRSKELYEALAKVLTKLN